MKALSLRQPWAWAVVHAGKRIENRTWKVRFRGPFLIHAAKGCTRAEYDGAAAWMRERGLGRLLPELDELARGGIVGRARLVDIVPRCGAEGCTCGRPWHMGGQYGFVLEDVEELPFTPVRGLQRFFELEEPARTRTKRASFCDPFSVPVAGP